MFKRKGSLPPKPTAVAALGEHVAVDTVSDPLVLQALAVWTQAKGEKRFPARETMTPRAMAPFLRNIVLVRVLDAGREYEFRVVGDAIVEVQGAAFQGLTLAQIDEKVPGYGASLRPIYGKLVAEGVPQAYRGQIQQGPQKRAFFHESLLLPLGSDATVDHILIVGSYTYTVGQQTTP